MIRINNIEMGIDEPFHNINDKVRKILGNSEFTGLRLVKKSIDARRKSNVHYICSVDVTIKNSNEEKLAAKLKNRNISVVSPEKYIFPNVTHSSDFRPIIIGTGPAGLFCGLMLAKHGFRPIILERGKCVEERRMDIEAFYNNRILNTNSNIQFGEGGAGTFSDGKLTTGIKDIRIITVLNEFVNYGAPEEILYLAKPHIGTDNLQRVVKNIRNDIIKMGGEVRFNSRVCDLIIENGSIRGVKVENRISGEIYELYSDKVVLATGHSGRDTFEMLNRCGVEMVQKPFSVGVRIEHPQIEISKQMYGDFHKKLPPADYKLSAHLENGRSIYTFCMCPGGYVMGSASEVNSVVTNGMSNYKRDGENANSAVLVGVNPSDLGSDNPLAGIEFQRSIERKAFEVGGNNYNAPITLVGDFLKKRPSTGIGSVMPTYRPNVTPCDISEVFPSFVTDTLRLGLKEFDRKLKGFAMNDAVLTAAETRSSSPVRLVRDSETMQLNIKGLFSAGEGGGHAGGITSSAVDGIKCAERVAELIKNEE